ncbi:MAG: hypothetical protein IK025_08720 [Bacteroidales bacterium]|nr:hypothetical protein [Bacteroidales bacterium]
MQIRNAIRFAIGFDDFHSPRAWLTPSDATTCCCDFIFLQTSLTITYTLTINNT